MIITKRLERENGRDYAMRIMKTNIINLEMAPGSAINDRQLAALLGVSRTPVREALLDLARVGIVEIYPQRGSSIALVDCSLVEEARFVRSVLERSVAEVACAVATKEDLKELWDHIELQRYYAGQGAGEKLQILDAEFHLMLFRVARKLQTYSMMQSLTIHFDRAMYMSGTPVIEKKWVDDHQAIFECIRDNKPALAAENMEKHLSRRHVDEELIKEKYPDFIKQETVHRI